jgi:hypothetical protein
MSRSTHKTNVDVVTTWNKISKELRKMTAAQKTQTLVESGILTKKGNVSKRYERVIVSAKKS